MPEQDEWGSIILRMRQADGGAINQFITFASQLLRREYLARRVPSAIAEDIAIDCTYTLAVRIHQFDSSRGTLHAWIRSSGLNALRDWFRANRHQTKLTYLENLACRPIYGQSLPDEAMHLVVQQALLRLSATDQSIMQMKFHEGLNHRQIADALGISHDNVRKHYERAISRLRTLLQQDRHVQARMLRSRPVATCT